MSEKIKKSVIVLELKFTPKQQKAVEKALEDAIKVNGDLQSTYTLGVQTLVKAGPLKRIKVNFFTNEFAEHLHYFLANPHFES